ncbi:MAG TPA: hypothetical protein VGR89_05385 [Puia sp.]|nr:hypothetical protein [Puia sp.]
METLPYTVIHSQNQYKAYCAKLTDLIKLKGKGRPELDTIDLLKLLTKRWEEQQRPLSDSDPVEYLQSLIQQNCLQSSKLAAEMGISKSLMTDILHYRRRMSRELIRKLAARFGISQELLNKPYSLIAGVKRAQPQRSPQPLLASSFNQGDERMLQLLQERTGKATTAKLQDGKEITIWNMTSGRRFPDLRSYLIVNVKPVVTGAGSHTLFTTEIERLIDPESGYTLFRASN